MRDPGITGEIGGSRLPGAQAGGGARDTVYAPRTPIAPAGALRAAGPAPPGPAPLGPALACAAALCAVGAQGCAVDPHDTVAVRQGDCYVCHQAQYEATTQPPHEGLFPITCGDCHTEDAWIPAVGFGPHDWFPLTEGHADRACAACHTEGYGPGQTPTECASCHRDDYDRSPWPGHNVYPTTCTDCHDRRAWSPATFAHAWELTGAHVGTPCARCHTGDPPRYEGTPTECVDCHRGDYDRAPFPNHQSFPTTCADCHATDSWRGPDFTHPVPLEGAHSWAPCSGCHTGDPPRYAGTPTECVACHRDDYDRSEQPGHNVYPTTCADCHGATTWIPSSFSHPWRLDGAHLGTACARCHTGDPPRWEGLSSACVDCHRDDYGRAPATHPGHETYAMSCTDCHTTSSWRDASFVHPWPLVGAHVVAPCGDCHTGTPPRHAGTPTDCVACHRDDYDRSTYPGHAAFPTTCADCHGSRNWLPSTFRHDWPIRGAHTLVTCASCHGDPPTYAGTPRECVGCHRDDHARAPFPGHATFPTTCADCHDDVSWRPASFTHSYPLTGAHVGAACGGCHTGTPPRYAGTPTDCVSCHRGDYDASTYPGHAAFSTRCADCHTTSAWTPSSHTHPWPLVGAHATAACAGCHTGTPPRYAGTPTDCVSCHRRDYDGAAFPGHSTYPTTCADCHGTFTWRGATFAHAPPLVGAHSRAPCAGCHTGTPPRYAGTPTDCVSCHRDDADRSRYLPHPTFGAACADCHGATGWTPATRGYHPEAIFRISSGRHSEPCVPCHASPAAPWWNGDNVDCTDGGCHYHSRTREDARHRGERGYPTGPAAGNYCLVCHERVP